MIEKGANVDDKDINEGTALISAHEELHIKVVKLLIEKNINIYKKNKFD